MVSLKQLSFNLEKAAKKYTSQDAKAKNLLGSLQDIIDRAKNGDVISSEQKIPGLYWFSEGGLSPRLSISQTLSKSLLLMER